MPGKYNGKGVDITGWIMAEHGVPESKWTVIGFDHSQKITPKSGETYLTEYWEVECSCANHTRKIVSKNCLVRGNSKSCGCTRKSAGLEGRKFGRLTVIKKVEKILEKLSGHYRTTYLCTCDCGNETVVTAHSLLNNNTRSCGCLQKEARKLTGAKNRKFNKYDLSGEYGIGYASNTGTPFYFDLEDYDKIKDYCWAEHVRTTGYHALETTVYSPKKKTIIMAVLLGGPHYDHINRNSLDNRKSNLRPATPRENNINVSVGKHNKSGVVGVCFEKRSGKWISRVSLLGEDGKKKVITHRFETKEEAIKDRLRMERDYYREFAPQRHLFAQYGIEDDSQ